MDMNSFKRRKTDARKINNIVRDTINNDEFSARTQVNTENIRLLLNDPDFQDWAHDVRRQYGIPEQGFKAHSKAASDWFAKRDDELWDEQMISLTCRYTKINPFYMPYIKAYVIFNNDFHKNAIAPLESYRVGRMEYTFQKLKGFIGKRHKIPQLHIEINAPLTKAQWKKLEQETATYFADFDMFTGAKAERPTKNLEFRLLGLKPRRRNTPEQITAGYAEIETDRDMVEKAFPILSPAQSKN